MSQKVFKKYVKPDCVSTTRTYHDNYEYDWFRIQGPLREYRSIRSGFFGLPYYHASCVCIPAVIGVLRCGGLIDD